MSSDIIVLSDEEDVSFAELSPKSDRYPRESGRHREDIAGSGLLSALDDYAPAAKRQRTVDKAAVRADKDRAKAEARLAKEIAKSRAAKEKDVNKVRAHKYRLTTVAHQQD